MNNMYIQREFARTLIDDFGGVLVPGLDSGLREEVLKYIRLGPTMSTFKLYFYINVHCLNKVDFYCFRFPILITPHKNIDIIPPYSFPYDSQRLKSEMPIGLRRLIIDNMDIVKIPKWF